MTIRYKTSDGIAIITIDRPERRNAADGPTAQALADAFRRFEADDSADVSILTGAGGTFCAGADLKAIAGGTPNRAEPDGDGPMGPSRMMLSSRLLLPWKATRSPAGLSSPCGATCVWRPAMRCSACSAAGSAYR